MTADIGIEQLNAFLARCSIELNCFDVFWCLSSYD
jgi:hypothetical protein